MITKKRILPLILAVLMLIPTAAVNVSAEERVTPSGIAYDDIGTKIEEFAAGKNYASFETAVFRGDEVLYKGCFGHSDRENSIEANEDTVYEWGSISKLFVWISVMQLYEQGKIDLNADIDTYLPAGTVTKLKYDDPITMINLMNHDAGWQETTYTIETANEGKIVPLAEAIKNCEPPQVNRPGEITSYSNWGATLAGYIVEQVSGMDYTDYVHKNILEPLGMEHTAVAADYRDTPWVRQQREKLKCYQIMDQMGVSIDKDLGQDMHFILLYPVGSVTGTLGDITKFAQSFVDDSHPLFEKKETLDLMLSGTSFYGNSGIARNCHGLWTEIYAVDTMGHGGNTVGCSAELVFDKGSKTGVVVLTNQVGEGVFCGGIPSLIFGEAADNPALKGKDITVRNDISSLYVNSRSYFRGATKMYSSMNFLPITPVSEDQYTAAGMATITRIGDDLYVLEQNGRKYFTSAGVTSDGRKSFALMVMDYVEDRYVILKLAALLIFALFAVIDAVILIVKLIKLIAKKKKDYTGAGMITAGQTARLIALAAVITAFCTVGSMGFFRPVLTAICCAEALCLLVFIAAALISAKNMFTRSDEKAKIIKYIFAVLANAFSAFVMIYFELFNFWTC